MSQVTSINILVCYFMSGRETWNDKNLSEPYWRLYWNANHGAVVSLGSQQAALGPQKIVLIPPHTPFNKYASHSVDHFFIHFVVSEPFKTLKPGFYEIPIAREPLRWIKTMIATIKTGGWETVDFFADNLLLVSWSLACLAAHWQPAVFADKRLEAVSRYVDTHLGERITNPMLSRLVGMNTGAFIRFFRQRLKITPAKYIETRRIRKASDFLKFTGHSIDRIAEDTGFYDRNHFTRRFIKHNHRGPAAFRKEHQPG
jgi:AraC-like DNA-binding protein